MPEGTFGGLGEHESQCRVAGEKTVMLLAGSTLKGPHKAQQMLRFEVDVHHWLDSLHLETGKWDGRLEELGYPTQKAGEEMTCIVSL